MAAARRGCEAGDMPESDEVEALSEELAARLTGRAIFGVDVVEFRATKTRPPAIRPHR